jgi:hypothetical protein
VLKAPVCAGFARASPAATAACAACLSGRYDHDSEEFTPCQSCAPGRFAGTAPVLAALASAAKAAPEPSRAGGGPPSEMLGPVDETLDESSKTGFGSLLELVEAEGVVDPADDRAGASADRAEFSFDAASDCPRRPGVQRP